MEKNQILKEFKGAMTEQFICQELALHQEVFYWAPESGTAEIDFLIQQGSQVVPIEVKAEENLKSKSLAVFAEKYKPNRALRYSMNFYREQNWLTNYPLYACFLL